MTKKSKLNQKNNKKRNFYILVFIVAILIVNVILLMNYASRTSPAKLLAHSNVYTKFIVGKIPGMAVESEYLFFGRVTRTGDSEKEVTIYPIDEPVLVSIYSSKEIAKNILVDINNFILYPENESVILTFSLCNLTNMTYANYTGNISIDYYEIKG